MIAADAGQVELVRILLEAGADTAPLNRDNMSAVMLAQSRNVADVVSLLSLSTKTKAP
jgi:hypothetical protein